MTEIGHAIEVKGAVQANVRGNGPKIQSIPAAVDFPKSSSAIASSGASG
jgi:hypothetical protein